MDGDRKAEVDLQGGLNLVEMAGVAYPEDGVAQSQATNASWAVGGWM